MHKGIKMMISSVRLRISVNLPQIVLSIRNGNVQCKWYSVSTRCDFPDYI